MVRGLSDDLRRRVLKALEENPFHPGRRFVLRFQGQKHALICRGLVDGAIRFEHQDIVFEVVQSGPDPGIDLVPEDEPDNVVLRIPFYGHRPTLPPVIRIE